MEEWSVIPKTILTFIVLLVLTRILGKKQLSQLTYFNYITGITLGALAGAIAIDPSIPFFPGLAGVIVFALLTILTAVIGLKSKTLRNFTDGEPTIVVRNGEMVEKSLHKLRLTIDALKMLLREEKVFELSEVQYAIFEPNGKLSVMLKKEHQPVTRKDMNIAAAAPKGIPTEVIADGKIVKQALAEAGKTESWLHAELLKSGLSVGDVLYAEIQEDGSLYISPKGNLTIH